MLYLLRTEPCPTLHDRLLMCADSIVTSLLALDVTCYETFLFSSPAVVDIPGGYLSLTQDGTVE